MRLSRESEAAEGAEEASHREYINIFWERYGFPQARGEEGSGIFWWVLAKAIPDL